jgi:hypothetical protein
MPVIGFVNSGSADASAGYVAAFRKGLGETGYVEGQNVTVEYHWLGACPSIERILLAKDERVGFHLPHEQDIPRLED